MKKIVENYKTHINKEYLKEAILSLVFLTVSLIINYYTGLYATSVASNPVSDIILSNFRVYDVDFFFIYGALALWAFFIAIIFLDPKKIAFSFKSIALFVVIRAIFVSLTHIAPFPGQIVIVGNRFFDLFSASAGDLFFSGHTGLPFLFALIFWKEKVLRYIMLAASVFFGIIVLMGHIHYTIDVAAAFFITYSIYSLALVFFKKDREYFYNGSIKNNITEII